MDYECILDSFGGLIEDDLKSQFDRLIKNAKRYHPFIEDVYKAAEEFVLRGGRRLGSCSTLMVYKGYTGEVNVGIVRACSGVELYRHSILIHDDIADTESLRRGGQTLHKIFEKRYDEHFGMGTAIFLGDMIYSLATRMILESGFDSAKLVEVSKMFSSDFNDINESQILDLLFEYKQPSVDEWTVMASKRAASLFRTSLLTGAVLASAPEKDCRILEDAGRHIGYAFDIQDDIIDTFASKTQYGREPCGDITKKKKPLHLIIALEKEENGLLANIMQRGDRLTEEDVKSVQDLIRECGALEKAKSISRDHANKALRLIPETNMNEEAKDFFVSFISYVVESLEWYK